MSNEQDWADWVAKLAPAVSAIGTIGAVITSLWFAGREGRRTRKAKTRQQAEQITSWLLPYDSEGLERLYSGLRVRNASNEVIYDLIAQTVGLQGTFRETAVGDALENNLEYGTLIGNVPPGEITSRIADPGAGMHHRFGVEIAFQDAAGLYWLRRGNGILKEVKKHPVELYGLPRPVGWEN